MKKLLVALVLVAVMVFGPICLAYAAPLPGSWSQLGSLSGDAAVVFSITAVKGTLYVGTYGGVWSLPMPPRLTTVTATGNIPALTEGGFN